MMFKALSTDEVTKGVVGLEEKGPGPELVRPHAQCRLHSSGFVFRKHGDHENPNFPMQESPGYLVKIHTVWSRA